MLQIVTKIDNKNYKETSSAVLTNLSERGLRTLRVYRHLTMLPGCQFTLVNWFQGKL